MKNLLWTFALAASLVFLGFAYYVKSHWMRTTIDARFPWVAENVGSRLPKLEKTIVVKAEKSSAPAPAIADVPVAAAAPAAPAAPEVFDLNKLATDRAAWPATVTLNTKKNFPAVVDGKVVGELVAPPGTEVKLEKISGGKLGVIYRGGGAWVFVEETDVIARTGKRAN
jgi:hypothetical protein